jgi:hypothetical protein
MSIFVDNEVVTKKRLFEILSVPLASVPSAREKRFQFPTRTDQDGNKRHLGRLLCNEYSIYVPSLNREVRVRWANSQKKDKDGNFEYFPTDNEMKSGEGGEVLMSDEMVYLFWYLCPMNRQSPFRKPHAPVFYEFLDNDHLARVSNTKDETRITAMSIVLGASSWPMSRLRTLAKGIGIGGVGDMTDDVVKSQLKDRAFKDPLTFINQAESREVAFTGKIQEAIDRNILVLKMVNGMQRWYLNNAEIIPVQYGIDSRKVLDDHLSAKWYMYSDEINQTLDNTSVASNLSQPENDEHFENPDMIETISEVDNELWSAYQALKADTFKLERVMKYADMDLNNPGIHTNSRKAAEALSEEIALYKKGLELEKLKG